MTRIWTSFCKDSQQTLLSMKEMEDGEAREIQEQNVSDEETASHQLFFCVDRYCPLVFH